MCYHYSLTLHALRSQNRYSAFQEDYSILEEYDELYHVNGFNFPGVPVIASDDTRRMQKFRWGLVPSWVKSKADAQKIRLQTLNARSESMFEKPAYRGAARAGRRCLIPADGIFEWQAVNKKKYPYYISMKDKSIFSMGGIWEEWTDRETGEIIKSFSLLTTEANGLMKRIHNDGERMPLIIPREYEKDWLCDTLTEEDVKALTITYPDLDMNAHTISKLITTRGVQTNVAEIQKECVYAELAEKIELF